jgi:triacylglycerol lipase
MTLRRAPSALKLSVLLFFGLPLLYVLIALATVAWRVQRVSAYSEQAELLHPASGAALANASPAAGPSSGVAAAARPAQAAGQEPGVDGNARTRYPVVLVHGMLGFESVFGMSYWYDLVPRLRAHGVEVYTPAMSSFNDSELRGQQLLPQVEAIVRAHGGGKVHLIGHSQGSMAARYVAAKRPDLVASVTSIAGPNRGSEVADWLLRAETERPWLAQAVMSFGGFVGGRVNAMAGTPWPIDLPATVAALSTPGALAFNQRYPAGVPNTPCGEGAHEVQGVRYYSYAGVGHWGRWYSLADQLMAITGHVFTQDDNDGLVGRCASHLGEVVRDDLPLNHFHLVRQLMGFTPDTVDVGEVYLQHLQRLQATGG